MSPAALRSSREDVLDAFAVEPDPNRQTLERYLRAYPDFAAELIDLSRELARDVCEDEPPLSAGDQAAIDQAWQRHAEAAPKRVSDPFGALSTAELRDVAKRLDVPRQVITAFRERRVILTSVPRRFLARLAEAVGSSMDHLLAAPSLQPAQILARSYKADGKPGVAGPVSFERLLIDAGVADERRTILVSDAD